MGAEHGHACTQCGMHELVGVFETNMHARLPHADGRCDGVANGHANQVDVLGQRAEPVFANS